MRNVKLLLIGLLFAAAYAVAGGTASVVAQKSKAKGFSYSYETKTRFINECIQGANQNVCHCVIDKIQQEYSENDYWRLENDLQKNIKHPDYITYVSKAVEECDEESAKKGSSSYGDRFGKGWGGISTKSR